MYFLRGSRFKIVMSTLVVVGCGGGKFISIDQGDTITGGAGNVVASGGTTSGDPATSTGGASVGGADTGGSNAAADNSGGAEATGGSRPTQAGSSSTGGLSNNGGNASSGGSIAATGGSSALGGDANSGGTHSTGGSTEATGGTSSSTGGERASGGNPPTGGTLGATGGAKPVTGGNVSTGGSSIIGTGGHPTSGGTVSTGGLTATGGQSSVTLTFSENPDATCTGLTVDTVLNSATPDLNYGLSPSFGCDASPLSVGLLGFVFEGCAAQIGTLSKVLAARLHLTTASCAGCQASPNTTVQVFELLEPWTEGTGLDTGKIDAANWNEAELGVNWTGAGATGASRGALLNSFKPVALNTQYVVELPASLVQRWLDNARDRVRDETVPSSNFGILLAITSTAVAPTDAVSFIASDGEKTLSPLLEIDFAAN